jgi:uncharacterized membrane protein
MTTVGEKSTTGIQPNVAGLLCYVLTWLTGIIFLVIEKENKFVRFHAFQSIITFGSLMVIDLIFVWTFIIPIIVGVLIFALWIILMIQAYQGKMFKLPLIGNYAEKLAFGSAKK